jgi:hypothetical protein
MSWDFYNNTLQVAKKDYTCDGCVWINQNLCDFIGELTFTEKRELVRARKNKYKIIKGQTYIKTKGMWEGEFSVFRAIPTINQICHNHNIYQF